VTSIYVTHDQNEALGLSHRIAVMNQGQIVQVGSPREIYEQPVNRFVAEFVGTTNFVPATVVGRDGAYYMVETTFGKLSLATSRALQAGDKIVLSIRPEHVMVKPDAALGINSWDATVKTNIFLGFHQDLEVVAGGLLLEARVHPSLDVPVGARVSISVAPDRCIVCD
jgi:iron(III) transport system ATP-binding protein